MTIYFVTFKWIWVYASQNVTTEQFNSKLKEQYTLSVSVKSQNAKKLVCYFTNYDLFYRALHFHQFAKTILSPSSSSFDIVVTIISSLTDIDVLDLLVQDEDLEELLLSLSCPFVFHSGMNCPVVSCGFSSFKTKKSYSRHSETRQKPHHIIIYCSIPRCKSTCRRKTKYQLLLLWIEQYCTIFFFLQNIYCIL